MPVETYVACVAAVVFFGSFMAILSWGMWYTRDVTPRW